MSGPEVRQIVKIWTVWKQDIFLPGPWTFENYLFGKMFEIEVRIQSGPTGHVRQIWCPVLSGQETHTYAQSGRAIVLCTTDQAAPDQMTIPFNILSCF